MRVVLLAYPLDLLALKNEQLVCVYVGEEEGILTHIDWT